MFLTLKPAVFRKKLKNETEKIAFCNTEDGMKLRLNSATHVHEHTKGAATHCALCGNGSDRKRSRRMSGKCKLCHVLVCMRGLGNQRKSCWEI